MRDLDLPPYLRPRSQASGVDASIGSLVAQLFHPSADRLARLTVAAALAGIALLAGLAWACELSGWSTGVARLVAQPVPFSHEHHVGGAGFDCRYCHETVETAAFAGMPATETCMHCHAHLFADAALLAPVRDSFAADRPLRWQRVHDLPDFVYFDHGVHVRAGVGCETCHGRVDRMPRIAQVVELEMSWCIDCHRDPTPRLRPPADVFVMGWRAHTDDPAPAVTAAPTSCSECHR